MQIKRTIKVIRVLCFKATRTLFKILSSLPRANVFIISIGQKFV